MRRMECERDSLGRKIKLKRLPLQSVTSKSYTGGTPPPRTPKFLWLSLDCPLPSGRVMGSLPAGLGQACSSHHPRALTVLPPFPMTQQGSK